MKSKSKFSKSQCSLYFNQSNQPLASLEWPICILCYVYFKYLGFFFTLTTLHKILFHLHFHFFFFFFFLIVLILFPAFSRVSTIKLDSNENSWLNVFISNQILIENLINVNRFLSVTNAIIWRQNQRNDLLVYFIRFNFLYEMTDHYIVTLWIKIYFSRRHFYFPDSYNI